jgi:hypothetical protein
MTYPIILPPTTPSDGKSVQLSVGKKNKKTGASELLAFSRICALGLSDIQEGVCVTIDGHRYEPDFAYIDRARGIYIDIEIDEPYTSDHHPTHYIEKDGEHKDARRNRLFCKNSWHVVRFSEEQMFCQTAACMKLVYNLIGCNDTPQKILNAPELKPAACWTAEEATKWSHQNYRRSYLGFDPIHMGFTSVVRCCMLAIPVLFRSLTNRRLRKMLGLQLKKFL